MYFKFNLKKILREVLKNATITNVITVGLITIIVSGLGFLKEMFIANTFGLSELIDTFYIAVLAPSLISGVFLGSFHSVFIPNYVNELKLGKNIGAFQTSSFLVTIGVSVLFLLFSILFTDVYLETFFKGHTQQYYNLIKSQFYFVAPCIIFWGFSSILSGLLTIDNEFKFSSLNPIFTPISIIICLMFFVDELGNIVLAMGMLIGSILSFLLLLIVALKRRIIHIQRPDFDSQNIKMLFRQLPAKLSSSLLAGINPLVDQYFSAQLIIGSIAALNYGIKIPAFVIGIMGAALGDVLLPHFSKNVIDNRTESFKQLKRILKTITLGSSLALLILFLLSTPIISVLFERNAFSSSDTKIVSQIQKMYLLQIPSYVAGLIIIKFLTAINRNSFMVFTSTLSLILNIFLNYLLIKKLGVYGLALSTSIVSFVNCFLLYIYINYLNKSNV